MFMLYLTVFMKRYVCTFQKRSRIEEREGLISKVRGYYWVSSLSIFSKFIISHTHGEYHVAKQLSQELDEWLSSCGLTKSSDVRGVIAPTRVFLLGPSHHYYTSKCALSTATVYKTPIGDLPIDLEVNELLKATGKFELMDIRVDEAEHSMEMHLPYLAKVFEGKPVKIVPILVGALSAEDEAMYGQILSSYFVTGDLGM
ncbi:hypothetical protein Lal_00001600 [Lupinus albus]|nr:hypothetical protein Lal_00001600 [Lupinus albus]